MFLIYVAEYLRTRAVMKVLYLVGLGLIGDVVCKRRPVWQLIRKLCFHCCHACLELLARRKVTNCRVYETKIFAAAQETGHAQDGAAVEVRVRVRVRVRVTVRVRVRVRVIVRVGVRVRVRARG